MPKRIAALCSLRQGNELSIAGHRRKAPCAPVRLRRFDPFLRRRDKIPPDNSRPVQLGSTDENEVCRDIRGQDNFALGCEDYESAGSEALLADLELSGDD